MNETNRDNIIDLMNENTRLRELLWEVRNSYGYTEDQWAVWREKADAALAKEKP